MHDGVWMTILGIVGLMTIAGLMLPVTRRLGFPYTVFLALIGIVLGLIANAYGSGGGEAATEEAAEATFGFGVIIGDLFHALDTFTLSSEVILFLFLPALVFESSLSIDLRKLLADIGPILFLAVVGLLVSAFLTASAISMVAAMPFVVCLLVGAILSATDPVAVVAIFKDLGAPKRLAVLVEGESLFNDATAIVLFHIVLAMIIGHSDADMGSGALEFATVFFGGIAVGLAMTVLFSMGLARAGGIALVEVTLTISLAYLSFLVAEHYLHVSGVMAVVTSALMLGTYGRTSMTATGWHLLQETWETIGFWANSLIFLLVGILVPQIVSRMTLELVGVIVVTVIAAFAARAVLTHGLLPMMIRWRVSAPVSLGFRTVMWWGGLRGAVSLALALAVAETASIPEDIRIFVMTVVCGFVLFTLFVNATTVGSVMRSFGLDQLDPTDQAIRDRAIRHELGQIAGQLPAFAKDQNIPGDIAKLVADGYATRASVAGAGDAPLPDDAWVRIGLAAQLGQERRAYLHHYAEGHISSPIARELVRQTDDLIDQMKTGGRAAYDAGIDKALGFDWRIRWAREVHRRLGIARPLAALLARRLERLRTRHAVAREMLSGGIASVEQMVGEGPAIYLREALEERADRTRVELDAIRLQYPEYALALERRYLERCAIRQERESYDRMHHDALIGSEVHAALGADVDGRYEALGAPPPLDLGLDPEVLVGRVPLFDGLNAEEISAIARLLRTRLVLPGERVITAGEAGTEMYFVSSGALRVEIGSGDPILIGSGEFVGEIALLHDRPRAATVTSVGFSDLLVLQRRAFQPLLDLHPELRTRIETVAATRLAAVQ